MGKGTNNSVAGHQVFKDRAKNRVDDLQGMFSDLQSARKESRLNDVALLEEQLHQMLREWKAELNEPTPASSFQGGGSLGSFSSEIGRLLQLCEEEDDATSGLTAPKPEPDAQKVGSSVVPQQALTRARVPIVKLMDPVTGISCDICVNNSLAVINTKLLRDYAHIDARLRQLAFIVKHWAKLRGVNETYQGTLSSYA